MMKKILKALSLVMVLVMCFTMAFTVTADGETTTATPTLTISGQTVEPSKAVTVTVAVADFADVAGAHFVINVPAELADVAVTSDFDGVSYDAEANTITFAQEATWTNGVCDGLQVEDATLVTITATAPAEEGTYNFTYGSTGKDVDFCDASLEAVTVTKVEGAVVVKAAVVEPVEDENLTITALLNLSTAVNASIRVTKASVADYDSYYLKVTSNKFDSDYNHIDSEVILTTPRVSNDTLDQFVYEGIGLHELTQPIVVTVCACNAAGDVVAYYDNPAFTMAELILSNTEKYASNTSRASLVKVYLDVINAGKAAQEYFIGVAEGKGVTDSDLSKDALPTVGFEEYQTFASTEYTELTQSVGTVLVGDTTLTTKVTDIVNIASGPSIKFRIYPIASLSAYSNVQVRFEYSNEKTGDVYNDLYALDDLDISYSGTTGLAHHIFDDIALYDADKTVKVSIYGNENLETPLLTHEYSLESLYAANMSKASLTDIMTALAKLGQSSKAYFYAS